MEIAHVVAARTSVSLLEIAAAAMLICACASPRATPRATTTEPSMAVADAAAPAASEQQQALVHELWTERRGAAESQAFCLGPGDVLEITVGRLQEMQGLRVRVSPAGTITLPMVGEIPAAGRTEMEVRDAIARRLGETVLRDPRVTLFVANQTSQQVSVTGAVARPGLIGLSRENRTVSDMLSEAGGLDQHSGGTVIFYPARGGDTCGAGGATPPVRVGAVPGGPGGIEIDLNGQWTPPTENPLNLPVIGGDAIVVNRGRFMVDGWVQNPGAYDITPGMTAFGGVTAAGGAMYPADLTQVVVWRTEVGGTKKRIDLDVSAIQEGRARDVTLQAGDVVQVPVSAAKIVPYSGYWILTNVVRVGAGLTLSGL
jgi:polysaccharide export outer membrane protein